jgi:hypothetical protein
MKWPEKKPTAGVLKISSYIKWSAKIVKRLKAQSVRLKALLMV